MSTDTKVTPSERELAERILVELHFTYISPPLLNLISNLIHAENERQSTALSSLQVENEKLREDKEMLDWLEWQEKREMEETSKCEQFLIYYSWSYAYWGDTCREAIRNAMKGTQ